MFCMRGGQGRLPIFLVFLFFSVLIFVFSRFGWMNGVGGMIQSVFLPVQKATDGVFRSENAGEVAKLREENAALKAELAKMEALEKDNAALRDQFKQSTPRAENLIPAEIVGSLGFLPGVSSVEEVVIDKGSDDGVAVGRVVVLKDVLVGRVVRVSSHLSVVNVVSHEGISFTAKTSKSSALGVLTGEGGGKMVLKNVLLSDKLTKGDVVVSKGDVGEGGSGVPAGLVVGKIVSVNRQASSLFQSAEVESLIDVARLRRVFVF